MEQLDAPLWPTGNKSLLSIIGTVVNSGHLAKPRLTEIPVFSPRTLCGGKITQIVVSLGVAPG